MLILFIQAYNGDDYAGARIVSRAYELRDVVCFQVSFHDFFFLQAYHPSELFSEAIIIYMFQVLGMLSQMDPALLTYCDKIAAQGGPSQIPDDLSGSILGLAPVVQMGTVTRSSARLRNLQPEVNLDRDYEGLKKPKKTADAVCTGNMPLETHSWLHVKNQTCYWILNNNCLCLYYDEQIRLQTNTKIQT